MASRQPGRVKPSLVEDAPAAGRPAAVFAFFTCASPATSAHQNNRRVDVSVVMNPPPVARSKPSPKRRRRRFSARFHMPVERQGVIVHFPAVKAWLLWQKRCILVRAAEAMNAAGMSQNKSAAALGIAASNLSVLLQA